MADEWVRTCQRCGLVLRRRDLERPYRCPVCGWQWDRVISPSNQWVVQAVVLVVITALMVIGLGLARLEGAGITYQMAPPKVVVVLEPGESSDAALARFAWCRASKGPGLPYEVYETESHQEGYQVTKPEPVTHGVFRSCSTYRE